MLASNLRAPGMSTLVLNLCLPNIPEPHSYSRPVSPWLNEYIVSSTQKAACDSSIVNGHVCAVRLRCCFFDSAID